MPGSQREDGVAMGPAAKALWTWSLATRDAVREGEERVLRCLCPFPKWNFLS